MPAVLVKFYGPTEHKGARFSFQAQGFPRKIYDRTHYELDPSEEIRVLAVRYAREVFKWDNPSVNGPYSIPGDQMVVIVTERR
jgi:uncharacterized protein YdgA (DUF945 family)